MDLKNSATRRVLFLAYLFPPVGGPGVQRSLKFVKYLPDFGWRPTVLTVKDITYYVRDDTLLEDVPADARIVSTESLDPLRLTKRILSLRSPRGKRNNSGKSFTPATDSFLVKGYRIFRDVLIFPDIMAGWLPFAFAAGLKIIREEKPDVIYSPGAPYTSAIIAYLLGKKTGIPYVIDFRDGWLDDRFHKLPTPLHRSGHAVLERLVVTDAQAIVTYDLWLSQQLTNRYPRISDRIYEIPNGFDPDDLSGVIPPSSTSRKRRIVYSGSLYERHNLNLKTLLNALTRLPEEILDDIEVIFVGTAHADAQAMVAEAGHSHRVIFTGYLPHANALGYLQSADATLLFVPPNDKATVTGKVFEYLMVGNPILAAAEQDGACARILEQAGFSDWLYDPMDENQLARHIMQLQELGWPKPSADMVSKFSRRSQTQLLAQIFEGVCVDVRNVRSVQNDFSAT